MDWNYVWTFISGGVVGFVVTYGNRFVGEYAKAHVESLNKKKALKKEKQNINKIVVYLKSIKERPETSASLQEIRDEVFGIDSDFPLSEIDRLLYKSFDNERNVGRWPDGSWSYRDTDRDYNK
ncbi:hypothetical protein P9684_04005 [Bacillus atrophaeus]|uniref:hypothetical protein n=1 Tax=Bacillus atrophaeus TaxID=1452 RepID=UPI00227FFFE0|nr:hypothetical protein [Bacillus atrophaeus]MCY8466973.1 hypothetical protein [Bacillus atrophaeus]MCY8475686.1 hypothetical protein [Bacillus atrophaeus]MED4799013.1 hypothetical protein [Bacillus atrophaeus]